jgi:hypothetical protein
MNVEAPKPFDRRSVIAEDMTNETLLESVESLSDLRDVIWSSGNVTSSGELASRSTFRFNREFVPKLTRVRKIIDDALQDPESTKRDVIPRLQAMLVEEVRDYEFKYDAAMRDFKAGRRSTNDSPAYVDRLSAQVRAPVACYLLGEFDDYSSLPLLSEVYSFVVEKKRTAVPPLFVFAAMDRMTRRHPTDDLSGDAKALRLAYFAVSNNLVVPGQSRRLPTWDAEFDESDPRAVFFGEYVPLHLQPKIPLTVYPADLAKFESDYSGIVKPELQPLANALISFIESAYPDYQSQINPLSN